VDPDIKVGAVLNTPPDDLDWGPDWNDDVLRECGALIDFAVIHWYPNRGELITISRRTMPEMFDELHRSFARHAGDNANNIEVTVTELGPPPGASDTEIEDGGLFAADAYLSFVEHGATNVDWLELHNGTFLNERNEDARGRAFFGIQFAHQVAAPGERLVATDTDRPDDLGAHAGIRDDGSLAVLLHNASPHRTVSARLEVPGADQGAQVRWHSAYESGTPVPVIGPERVDPSGGELRVEIEPRTMALIEFDAP
jgi:hypothetical protein